MTTKHRSEEETYSAEKINQCGGGTHCPDFTSKRVAAVSEHCQTLLIWTGGSTPLLCLEGVPDLPVAPQDEAGLTKTFQTWPRGWFHIP